MDFTYPEVGLTLGGEIPSCYRRRSHSRVLRVPFQVAAEALMTWQTHVRTGLRPRPTSPRVEPGAQVVVMLGPVRAPCQVVWVIQEPDTVGWAYGTLTGHPLRGEESFVLDRLPDGRARFTVTAISKAVPWPVQLGQALILRLYGLVLDRGPTSSTA